MDSRFRGNDDLSGGFFAGYFFFVFFVFFVVQSFQSFGCVPRERNPARAFRAR
jgi:hypothetical protein